jgi:ATP-dependent exoDNAse (exonuclease V) beta subunit
MSGLTKAQLAVVLAEDRCMLVGAGAGSGKTTTVVQKLCYLLGASVEDESGKVYRIADPLTLDQIAAITYTNQAAADLKRKLRSALVGNGLRQTATEVDSATFGTIHGFCGNLLRDQALRAGVSPAQRVLEDGEAAMLNDDCARTVLRQAVELADVPELPSLLGGRRLNDLAGWIAALAADRDRLAHWSGSIAVLRDHERALFELARRTAELRNDHLRASGEMDFDRMIVATRDLLRDNDGVRRAMQRQLRVLIVDEFQDVDPAQRDIAMLLGGLTREDPAPSRLVLVGDPKQSIYRFRRADVSLWNGIHRQFTTTGAGAYYELSDNFRSRKGILAFVDDVIGAKLAAPVDADAGRQPFEVDYAPLDARSSDAAGNRAVELVLIGPGDDGKVRRADDVRALEAGAVAQRIAELKSTGTPYGDMAILLAGWGALDLYQQALRDAGIPTYALRGQGFWEAREVLDCILALRAIRDPRDDEALAGFLKGPFVGVRDDTLLALAFGSAGAGMYDAITTEPRERALLDRAIALLDRFGALRDRVPVHVLLQSLIEESGFLASLIIRGDGERQAVANVRKLLRTAAATPEISVGEFVVMIAESRERGEREAHERLYRERADVVTITSVHSAKGLEWPVVFWSDLVREVSPPNEKLLSGRELFRLKEESDDDDANDEAHGALKATLVSEQMAEAYRLWYVAATRAKKLLVLSGVPRGEGGRKTPSPARMLLERFGDELDQSADGVVNYAHADGEPFELVVRTVGANAATMVAAPSPRAVAEPVMPPAIARSAAGRARLSATQLMTFDHDPAQWWSRYVFGFEGTESVRRSPGGGSARGIGQVVHAVLERYGREILDIEELVDSAIARYEAETGEELAASAPNYRQRIRELVDAAIGHPLWTEIAGNPTARRELAFTRLLADGSTIEGAFDLAAVSADGVRIVDVKTGSGVGRDFATRYAAQAATYLDAARAITGNASATFTLLMSADGTSADVPDTGDVGALVQRLRATERPSRESAAPHSHSTPAHPPPMRR